MAQRGFGQLLGELIRDRREAAGMTQRDLAEESFPEQPDHEGKERRIRELELGQVGRPQARNYAPICETLNIDRTIIGELKRAAADTRAQNDAEFAEVIEDRGSVEFALTHVSALDRREVERLAERFGIHDPESQSDSTLARLLSLKAEEYRILKSDVEAIGETYLRLSNLKVAAGEAIGRADLEKVEQLLSRVQEVELEEAARTAEIRANNALLRGKTKQAYHLYCASADSFSAVDAGEPPRRRNQYYRKLYHHGLSFGPDGLQLAIEMILPAIEAVEHDKPVWAKYMGNLAIALDALGTRTEKGEGAKIVNEALDTYRAVLSVFTEIDYPLDWAKSKQNLGLALQRQGAKTAGAEGTAILAEAIDSLRASLRVLSEADHPISWGIAMNNLGNVLQSQANRNDDVALLQEAEETYRAALRVRDEVKFPLDWAMTMQNLAMNLDNQGTRCVGDEGKNLLSDAADICRESLRVLTEAKHPMLWAQAMVNLGITLKHIGQRTPRPGGNAHFAEADEIFQATFRIRTRAKSPMDWANTHANLASLEIERAEIENSDQRRPHFAKALEHNTTALSVFNPETSTYMHGELSKERDRILSALNNSAC